MSYIRYRRPVKGEYVIDSSREGKETVGRVHSINTYDDMIDVRFPRKLSGGTWLLAADGDIFWDLRYNNMALWDKKVRYILHGKAAQPFREIVAYCMGDMYWSSHDGGEGAWIIDETN